MSNNIDNAFNHISILHLGPDDYTGPEELRDQVLGVEHVEFYASHNAALHKTEKYELVTDHNTAVMRRGQTFLIGIRTTSPFSTDSHNLRIVFDFGSSGGSPSC